jgi:hypothetical protein
MADYAVTTSPCVARVDDMIALLAFLLSVQTPASPPPASPWERASYRAVALDQVLAEFAEVCLARFPSAERFRAAARASSWNYSPSPRPDMPNREEWRSASGIATFIRASAATPHHPLPQCNFDAATRESHERTAVVQAIETVLLNRLGATPRRTDRVRSAVWRWRLRRGRTAALHLIQLPGADPRLLTLSLQTSPAEAGDTIVPMPSGAAR